MLCRVWANVLFRVMKDVAVLRVWANPVAALGAKKLR